MVTPVSSGITIVLFKHEQGRKHEGQSTRITSPHTIQGMGNLNENEDREQFKLFTRKSL